MQMNSQMQRYIGQSLGGSQAQELPPLWSWGASPSQYTDVFTKTSKAWELYEPITLRIFKEA